MRFTPLLVRTALLLGPTTALAGTVCPTVDPDGQPCDHSTLDDAMASAFDGAVFTVYAADYAAPSLDGLAGGVTLIGAPMGAQARPRITSGTLAMNCTCSLDINRFELDNGGSASLVRVDAGTLHLIESQLTDSTTDLAVSGAAAVVTGGKLELLATEVSDFSVEAGSPILTTNGSLIIRSSWLHHLEGTVGGAISTASTQVLLSDSEFHHCDAAGDGGVLNTNGGSITIVDSLFRDNSAIGDGGSLAISNAQYDITNSAMLRGYSDRGGAAMISSPLAPSTYSFVGHRDNVAVDDGGALDLTEAPFGASTLSDLLLIGNSTEGIDTLNVSGGGAIVSANGQFTLERSRVEGNSAVAGGALGLQGATGSTLVIRDSALIDNTASDYGGAIAIFSGAGAVIENNRIEGNQAAGLGGGLWHQAPPITSTNNLWCDNQAASGGAISDPDVSSGGTLTSTGDVFLFNDATQFGGAVARFFSNADLTHATFLGNGSPSGAHLYLATAGPHLVDSSVMAHAPEGTGIATASRSTDVSYTVHWDNQPASWDNQVSRGQGVLESDPLLASQISDDGDCSNDDWTPPETSPLIDAGNPGLAYEADNSIVDAGATGGRTPLLPADLPTGPVDADLDGFVSTVDCDDSDPGRGPGMVEICDALDVDEDCDGSADDDDPQGAFGKILQRVDLDGDGLGGLAVWTCGAAAEPPGGDCDDGEPSVGTGFLEICGDGLDNDCDGLVDGDDPDAQTQAWFLDADGDGVGGGTSQLLCNPGDGYVLTGGDCDDDDPYNTPGGVETCDGQDNDCNGYVDAEDAAAEGLVPRYGDADSDGFAGTLVQVCPDSILPVESSDCNDGDSEVHPGADEYCDAVDSDCDGGLDDPDAVDATAWFTDEDRDGYGAGDGLVACEAPDGRVSEAGDCDDTDGGVHPNQDESCDGVDEDCDGAIDEDAGEMGFADGDGDGFGAGDLIGPDCGASGLVASGDDCDDTDSGVYPDSTEIPGDGTDQDCDGLDDIDVDNDGFGSLVDCADGDPDIHPNATDQPNNDVDEDCSGEPLYTALGGASCSHAPAAPSFVALLVLGLIRRRAR